MPFISLHIFCMISFWKIL